MWQLALCRPAFFIQWIPDLYGSPCITCAAGPAEWPIGILPSRTVTLKCVTVYYKLYMYDTSLPFKQAGALSEKSNQLVHAFQPSRASQHPRSCGHPSTLVKQYINMNIHSSAAAEEAAVTSALDENFEVRSWLLQTHTLEGDVRTCRVTEDNYIRIIVYAKQCWLRCDLGTGPMYLLRESRSIP